MNSKPFFSICMPHFNRYELFKETINSIFMQTFKDYEIIVQDDHSTDVSLDYSHKLVKQDKIKYFYNKKNLGFAKTLKLCVKHSTGKYIFLLSDDDIIVPSCLEEFFKVLSKKKNIGLIRSGTFGFLAKRKQIFHLYLAGKKNKLLLANSYDKILYYYASFVSGWAIINKKPTTYGNGIQDCFLQEVFSKFRKYDFYFIAKPLIGARVHTNLGYNMYKTMSPWFELDSLMRKYAPSRLLAESIRSVKLHMVGDGQNIKIYSGRKELIKHIKWFFTEPIPKSDKLFFLFKSLILFVCPSFLLIWAKSLVFRMLIIKNKNRFKFLWA